jgi:phosphatidylserine/phosphatidylglycerophosphate/cardiolipin synthase-like enzyme
MNKMTMDKLQATGTVRGVFFSLGTTPAINDLKFDCAKAVIDLFDQATTTAHVAIYSLTEPDIVDSIIAAHERGVDVAILADATESKNSNQATLISKLAQAGVDVRLAIRQKALMHNKVGIFDGKTICTGSFNWTNNAERHNDENLLVVDGSDVAEDYEKYIFQRILQNETLIRATEWELES